MLFRSNAVCLRHLHMIIAWKRFFFFISSLVILSKKNECMQSHISPSAFIMVSCGKICTLFSTLPHCFLQPPIIPKVSHEGDTSNFEAYPEDEWKKETPVSPKDLEIFKNFWEWEKKRVKIFPPLVQCVCFCCRWPALGRSFVKSWLTT